MDPNAVIEPDGLDLYIRYLSNPSLYIPHGMLLFAFFASLIWTVLKIIELISRKPFLEFRITREFFLRIFGNGECFYTNAVLVAYNAGALIEGIAVKLERRNGSTKSFNLDVINLGEKVRSEEGLSKYYFYSSSPICSLPDSIPQRIAYLCSQADYAELIRKAYSDFSNTIFRLKEKYSPAAQEANESELAKAAEELKGAIEETSSSIIDSVQIEPGNYKLSMKLFYRQRGRIFPFYCKKETSSSLKFVVEANVREILKRQIYQYVSASAKSILFNEKPPLFNPEYIPVEIIEQA